MSLKLRFLVSYDGTGFCGWQRQNRKDAPSIQQTLEAAFEQVFQQKIVLYASGRTDSGVHAFAQVGHFEVDVPEDRFKNWDLCWAMRGLLPSSICVRKIWIAPPEFHATHSAVKKTYRYLIYNHPRASPFFDRTAHWIRPPLDLGHLQESSQYLLGKHDFKSFQSAGTPVLDTVREIYEAKWEKKTRQITQFTITGEGFLKQMVRNIVGTQLQLASEQRDPADIASILAALDRRTAGPSAPAKGLYLWKVFYPRDLDKQCRPL